MTDRQLACISLLGAGKALAALITLAGCRGTSTTDPVTPPPERSDEIVLAESDEALVATLLADDPGDFHAERARIWRIGAARWSTDVPELPARPATTSSASLARALEAVVVDPERLRVLLPLDQLDWQPPPAEPVVVSGRDTQLRSPEPVWQALRLVAALQPGDLVSGLRVELTPAPWLALAAGLPLTPLDQDGDRLRVGWDDPQCGFGLTLAIEPKDFGPLYQPGPLGSADLESAASEGASLRLEPGAAIYPDAQSKQALVHMHAGKHADARSWVGQRISVEGKPSRGRQAITLRCRGVVVKGWVEVRQLRELPGTYAFVEQSEPPALSTCARTRDAEPIQVLRGTILYAPERKQVIGVVVSDIELAAKPGAGGWWSSCAPSPWGDLEFGFRIR